MRSAGICLTSLAGRTEFVPGPATFVVTDTDGSSCVYAGVQNPTSFQSAMRAAGRRVRSATAAELAAEPEDVRLTALFRIGSKRMAA